MKFRANSLPKEFVTFITATQRLQRADASREVLQLAIVNADTSEVCLQECRIHHQETNFCPNFEFFRTNKNLVHSDQKQTLKH